MDAINATFDHEHNPPIQVGEGDGSLYRDYFWRRPDRGDTHKMPIQHVNGSVIADALDDGFTPQCSFMGFVLFKRTRPPRLRNHGKVTLRRGFVAGVWPGKKRYAHACVAIDAHPGLRRGHGFDELTLFQSHSLLNGKRMDCYLRLHGVTISTVRRSKEWLQISMQIGRYELWTQPV